MQLSFQYSIEYELYRIAYTFQRTDFYQKNGYTPTLPAALNEESPAANVLSVLAQQYNEALYAIVVAQLQTALHTHAEIVATLEAAGIVDAETTYKVYITQYGVGGSFGPPNQVVLKVRPDIPIDRLFGTLLHELVHLHIHDWVVQYELSHWQKERIVDLVGERLFSNLRSSQVIREDVQAVDDAFASHYPNLEPVIAAAAKASAH